MAATKKDVKPGSFSSAAKQKPSMAKSAGRFFLGSKKWWLMPMVIVLVLLAALFVLSSSVVAPFIYTLF